VDLKAVGLQNAKHGTEAAAGGGESTEAATGEKVPDPFSLAGWLTGDLAFRANSKAEALFTGSGSAAVRRAQLWGFPCFSCVRELLNLPAEAAELPQEFRCAFTAENDKVVFSRIDLTSERVKVFGKGLAYYSGNTDLDLSVTLRDGRKPEDPLAEGLKGIFGDGSGTHRYRVSVTGDVASPDAALATKAP
jgi:hypothetical protein